MVGVVPNAQRYQKVLIPYFQQENVHFQNRLVGSRSACLTCYRLSFRVPDLIRYDISYSIYWF